MLLMGGNEVDGAMMMFVIVPFDEAVGPETSLPEGFEGFFRQRRMVFERTEERLRVGVVVTYPGPRVRGSNTQPGHEGMDIGGFERRAVVTVKDQSMPVVDTLIEACPFE